MAGSLRRAPVPLFRSRPTPRPRGGVCCGSQKLRGRDCSATQFAPRCTPRA